MSWSSIGEIGFVYLKIRPFLPATMQKMIDRFSPIQSPSRKQIADIEALGESIGLDKKEVYAAVGSPIGDTQLTRRQMTPLSVCIFILIIIISGFVILVLSGYFLDPPFVYGAGTRYGSIKPQDFISD